MAVCAGVHSAGYDLKAPVMDAADLQSELKSNRRGSLSGGVGFHETVEQVVEVSDREYYSFLNLTPDCTDDEIKVAYKRLALLWHPDRHKDADSRERATAQFGKLTQIHDVLTDPKRRTF